MTGAPGNIEKVEALAKRAVARDLAREKLSRVLYETLEHLDPGCDESLEWEALPPRDRELYGYCISALLARRSLLQEATDDDMITGHAKTGEKSDCNP